MFVRSLVFAAGAITLGWVLVSIVRTVVIPRPERVWLTGTAFRVAWRVSRLLVTKASGSIRHKVLGAFAPSVLISLPLIWSGIIIFAFAGIYWAIDASSFQTSLEFSGSSITTLGSIPAPNTAWKVLGVVEALLGLGIIALMISFLPSLYGTFSRREIAVGKLSTRAGAPPNPITFLTRLHAIGRFDRLDENWTRWEEWFVELGETHTSFPALVYFRSASPDRSWLTAAETALDTAAIVNSLKIDSASGGTDLMIRSGSIALRSIADFYRIPPEATTQDFDSLGVSRAQFEQLVGIIVDAGVITEPLPDDAWEKFAGWRMNYDRSVVGLRALVGDLPTYWNSDDDMVVLPNG